MAAVNEVIRQESDKFWGSVNTALETIAAAVTLSRTSDLSSPRSAGSLSVTAGKFSQSEMRAAEYMASQGNNVVLRAASGAERTSDLLVNGMRYDVYTPTTSNVNRIISAIAKKNSQADGVVLDLSRSNVTPAQLGNALRRVQGAGATKLVDIVAVP